MLARIRAFLAATGMAPTAFGRAVANDPRLIGDMERGREPRGAMLRRIETFLARGGAAR